MGSTQADSGIGAPRPWSKRLAGPRSMGRARRRRPSRWSKHTLVAMRYSHERSAERPSKRSNAFHARVSASWTASSASNGEPSMR